MSVLLSSIISDFICSAYGEDCALEVGGLWDGQQDWMVFRLSPVFQQPEGLMGVNCRRCNHLQEFRWADMERARTGHQRPSRPQHFERPEVEFFVGPHGLLKCFLTLSEGRRIEDDGVV